MYNWELLDQELVELYKTDIEAVRKIGGCGEVMNYYSYWDKKFKIGQLCIGESVVALLYDEGIWVRFGWWKQQGYWITWSAKKRFGERFGYEKPIWQIGKGVKWRLACFFLETPTWYKKEKIWS